MAVRRCSYAGMQQQQQLIGPDGIKRAITGVSNIDSLWTTIYSHQQQQNHVCKGKVNDLVLIINCFVNYRRINMSFTGDILHSKNVRVRRLSKDRTYYLGASQSIRFLATEHSR